MKRNISVRTKPIMLTTNKSKTLKNLVKLVNEKLCKKYNTDENFYNKKIVNDIVYNEKSNLVSKFKDFLIHDDLSEFLKRFYNLEEIRIRLPKIAQFYGFCSKVFPNYIILNEAKYIYKNIIKKQKVIDYFNIKRNKLNDNQRLNKKLNEQQVFDTNIIDSIMNQTETEFIISQTDNLIKVVYNNEIKENVNIFNPKKENSLLSIENLIDRLDKVEKFNEKKIKETSNTISSPSITQREKSSAIVSNSKRDRNEKILVDLKKHQLNLQYICNSNENRYKDNLKNNLNSNVNNHIKINNLVSSRQNSILNKFVIKKEHLETNGLQKKIREIKSKNIISSDLSNITAIKDKMKREMGSTLTTAYQGSSIISNEKLLPKSNLNEIPDTFILTRITENLNNSISGSKSNKIFFKKIMTPNFEVKEKLSKLKENIKETKQKIQKLVLKIDHNNIQVSKNSNPENKISINTHRLTLSVNKEKFQKMYNQNITAKLKDITSKGSNNNEIRDSTNSLTARPNSRPDSLFKNIIATMKNEYQSKNNLMNKFISTIKECNKPQTKGVIMKIYSETDRLSNERTSKVSHFSNRVSVNDYSNLINRKASISPEKNGQNIEVFTKINPNLISNLTEKKSNLDSNKNLNRINLNKENSVKKVFDINSKMSTIKGKLADAKGFPIKNFSNLIKLGQSQAFINKKANSDRTHVKNIDRMIKN